MINKKLFSWSFSIFYFTFAFLSSGCTSFQSHTRTFQVFTLQEEMGNYFTEFKLGSRSLRMLWDTGASHSVIDKSAAEELIGGGALDEETSKRLTVGGILQSSTGSSLEVSMRVLDLKNFQTQMAVDGIIGTNDLKDKTVTYDFKNHQILLDSDWRIKEGLAFQLIGGVPVIPLEVDGKAVTGLLDTGFSGSLDLVLPEVVKPSSQGKKIGETGITRMGIQMDSHLRRYKEVSVFGSLIQDAYVEETNHDLPGINFLVGSEILAQGTLVIDYPGSRALWRPYKNLQITPTFMPLGVKNTPGGPMVANLLEGHPWDALQIGDKVLSVDGQLVHDAEGFRESTQELREYIITFQRGERIWDQKVSRLRFLPGESPVLE